MAVEDIPEELKQLNSLEKTFDCDSHSIYENNGSSTRWPAKYSWNCRMSSIRHKESDKFTNEIWRRSLTKSETEKKVEL